MAGLNDVKNSPYLAKEDFPQARELTIKGHRKENVAREGDPEELKVIMYFHEVPKGLRLNMTNSQTILNVCGLPQTADFNECNGQKVTLYNDQNVMMGGKPVGGIRVWVQQQAPQGVPGQVYPAAGQNVGNPNNQAQIDQAMANKGIQYGAAPENSREATGDGPVPTF